MKREGKNVLFFLVRYLILIIVSLAGLGVIYSIFSPLTKYPVFWILGSFFPSVLLGDYIIIGEKTIEIAGACIAGSAYYFLFVLNLSTPKIKLIKRMKMLLLSFGIFLIANLARIVLLGIIYVNNSPFFDITHKILWYAGSTVLVVLIWFYEVKVFRIKKVPVYSDLKYFYKNSSLKKK